MIFGATINTLRTHQDSFILSDLVMKTYKNWPCTIKYDVDDYSGEDVVVVDLIIVDDASRGQWRAKKTMQKFLTEVVDANDMRCELCAYPNEDGVDKDRLVDFYENFGFSVDCDNWDCADMSR